MATATMSLGCLEGVLRANCEYRKNHVHAPNHIALTEDEITSLYQEMGNRMIFGTHGDFAQIFGMRIKEVPRNYNGVRIWASNPTEPLEKFSACGCCGAPWLPQCNYCGRVG